MKKIIVSIATVIILFLLQTSVFQYFSFGGIVPNLMLVVISVYGFMRGEYDGLLTGFICGLLTDIFFMDFLGFYALLYMYIGFLNGLLHKNFLPDDFRLPLIAIGVSDLTASLLNYLLLFLLNGRLHFEFYFKNIIFAELVYTLGIAIVLYPLILLLEYKFVLVDFGKESKDAV